MTLNSRTIAGFGLATMLVLTPLLVFADGPVQAPDPFTGAPLSGGGGSGSGTVAPLTGGGSDNGSGSSQPTLQNPLGSGTNSIAVLIGKVIDVLIQVGLIVIVLSFLWAGFKFITAFGDEKKVTEAKNIFFYTVIGAGVLLGSKVIATVIQTTVNSLTH